MDGVDFGIYCAGIGVCASFGAVVKSILETVRIIASGVILVYDGGKSVTAEDLIHRIEELEKKYDNL